MALRLWNNRISDVVPLTNLQNLEELQLQNNLIVDYETNHLFEKMANTM